jgi:hypothetical protein
VRRYSAYRHTIWRMIEGQYRPATMKLVDSLSEQALLEDILDRSKPPVPTECQRLDYQFKSPFRYGKYPHSSRFRRAGRTPGVYYGAEHSITAAIEFSWARKAFFQASPNTPLPQNPIQLSAIQAEIVSNHMIDLTWPDIAALGPWTDPDDYEPCCALADQVRKDGGQVIVYASVRDPDAGRNVAVLTCDVFGQDAPIGLQTWQVILRQDRVILNNESRRQTYEYLFGDTAFMTAAG